MADYTVSISELLWIAGAICTLAAAWKILKDNPISKHETILKEHEAKIKQGFEKMEHSEEAEKLLVKCMFVIIDHEITGNSVDKMKEIRAEMQEYLIEK